MAVIPALGWSTVARGAAVGLVFEAIGIAGYNLADAAADFGQDSNIVFVFYLFVVVGWAGAGHVAALRERDMPLTAGALAAACSVVPLAIAAVILADDLGETIGGLIAHAFVAATAGIVGALVAARREAR